MIHIHHFDPDFAFLIFFDLFVSRWFDRVEKAPDKLCLFVCKVVRVPDMITTKETVVLQFLCTSIIQTFVHKIFFLEVERIMYSRAGLKWGRY